MMTLPRKNKPGYAVVDQPIAPHQTGRIKYQGSYLKAALADTNCNRIEAVEPVQVVGVQGITQLVVPAVYKTPVQFQN